KTFFGGFVPSEAMRNGDFTDVAALFNPYTTRTDGTRDRFQCEADGVTPTAVNADGSQVPGATTCDIIPPDLINPAAQQMINFYPLPNVSNNSTGNYVNSPVKKLDEGKFDVRLDHNFSGKDSLFARFSYDQATVFLPGGSPGFAEPDAFASTQDIDNHGRNASLSETHIFSSNSINQFSAGYNRIFNHIRSIGSGTCISQQLGIQNANIGCGGDPPVCTGISCGLTSTIVGGGYWNLGDRVFAAFQGGTIV